MVSKFNKYYYYEFVSEGTRRNPRTQKEEQTIVTVYVKSTLSPNIFKAVSSYKKYSESETAKQKLLSSFGETNLCVKQYLETGTEIVSCNPWKPTLEHKLLLYKIKKAQEYRKKCEE